MTYSPGGPGFPPSSQPQQPPTSYGAPGQGFVPQSIQQPQPQPQGPAPTPSEPGESKLPLYLTIAVAVLGLFVYFLSFAPLFGEADGADVAAIFITRFEIVAALAAGLLAAVNLLPKEKNLLPIAAVLAVVGFLLAIFDLIKVGEASWGIIVVVVLAALQAIAAVVVLLFDEGVITPPVPRPKYEQYGYGAPGGYYQMPGQQQQPRPGGYPPQQGYGGYPQGPTTGGFAAQPGPQGPSPAASQHSQQNGPPTPPTGFPQYSPPPASSSASAPTTAVPTASPQPPAQPAAATPPQQSGSGPS